MFCLCEKRSDIVHLSTKDFQNLIFGSLHFRICTICLKVQFFLYTCTRRVKKYKDNTIACEMFPSDMTLFFCYCCWRNHYFLLFIYGFANVNEFFLVLFNYSTLIEKLLWRSYTTDSWTFFFSTGCIGKL